MAASGSIQGYIDLACNPAAATQVTVNITGVYAEVDIDNLNVDVMVYFTTDWHPGGGGNPNVMLRMFQSHIARVGDCFDRSCVVNCNLLDLPPYNVDGPCGYETDTGGDFQWMIVGTGGGYQIAKII